MLKKLILIAFVVTGCAGQPASEVCKSGIICPADTKCAAAQAVCITTNCGDGITDPNEQCDDGNILDGDGCAHDCKKEGCGNGIMDPGEDCDPPGSTTSSGTPCSMACKFEVCGNGVVDPDTNEQCDDGTGNTDAPCTTPDYSNPPQTCSTCSTSCSIRTVVGPFCGDHVCDAALGEDVTTCSGDCAGCGNGAIDPGEECDLGAGNTDTQCPLPAYANNPPNTCSTCTTSCTIDTVVGPYCGDHLCDNGETQLGCPADCTGCGNGLVEPGEECDNGAENADDKDCTSGCKVNVCGDGHTDVNGHNLEQCDDGNTVETDGCTNECTNPHCGNGILDGSDGVTPAEQCDLGAQNDDHGACLTTCRIATCGDNQVETGVEECDGAAVGGFNCSADCHLEKCGNGIIDPNENCDDGNTLDNDGCSSTCRVEYCGDGTQNNVTEACDASGAATQQCDIDCTAPSCGDGIVNTHFTPMNAPGPEQCDPPAAGLCSALCQYENCGNGIIDPGEQCDGAAVGGFNCAADCHLEKCGNGILDPTEECDDGNTSNTDDCVSSDPHPANCKRATCGDLHIDANTEDCDDGSTNNGRPGDSCSATCHTVTCGDGIIEQGEECDDGAGNNGAGKPCNASCHHNVCGDGDTLVGVEQCDSGSGNHADCDNDCTRPVCGDGIPNTAAGESCDHGTLNGTSGDSCGPTCKSTSCGNGVVDNGEQCDPGTGVPADDAATCDDDCTAVDCGDGHINTVKEACDDGALNGNPCGYNDPSCTRCNSTCTGTTSPGGPFCGDAVIQTANETCDNGNDNGATTCPYNTSCNLCSMNCQTSTPAAGATCGDGNIDEGHELCDDHNTNTCGLCSSDCTAVRVATKATGFIVTPDASGLTVQKTFTINDGLGTTAVFEIDENNMVTAPHVNVHINATDTANQVAQVIANKINGVPGLQITAGTPSGGIVPLTHDRFSSKGNVTITWDPSIGTAFSAFGMTGGVGGDCTTGVGCTSDDDCVSHQCTGSHVCQ
jgi:cysteine-rich repeat protein